MPVRCATHLAQRTGIYIIGVPTQREAPVDADVVLLNLRDHRWISCEAYYEYLVQLDAAKYGITFASEDVLVIQRDTDADIRLGDLLDNWPPCTG